MCVSRSLFSLSLCTWTGQYVKDRGPQGQRGQPLSTSVGSWERLAAICDPPVIPQLLESNEAALCLLLLLQQTSSLTTAKCLSHATSKELTQNNEFKSWTVLYLRQHQEPSLKQWLIHFSCFSAGFLSVKARRILLADEIEIWYLLTPFTPALNFTQYF